MQVEVTSFTRLQRTGVTSNEGIEVMSRKLKMICVACVAVFALTAVSASSAMATTSGFTVGTGGTTISGAQSTTQKLVIGAGGTTVKCTTSTLSGSVTAGLIHEATLTPAYSGCTVGGVSTPVDTNSCTYTITDTETANTYNADLTNCPSTAPIKITISANCTVSITNQGPLLDIDAANNTTGSIADVDATLTVKSITYTGTAGCLTNLIGTHSDGELTGGYTLKAFNGATQVSLATD